MARSIAGTVGPVAGVIIWSGDFPRLLAFYRDTLALTPRSVKPSFANFEWGGFRFSLGSHSRVNGPNHDPERIMVNFQVDDIHAAHRRLVSAGVRFTRPPEREAWGGWVATFHDPDGNTIQLLQLNNDARIIPSP